jgi:hypothetical protein
VNDLQRVSEIMSSWNICGVVVGESGCFFLPMKRWWSCVSMLNASAGLLLLKSGRSFMERFSCLSSGVLRAYLLDCLQGEGFNYRLLLLPRQPDGALSLIIVLATVVSLYIPCALSSNRRYHHVYFWTFSRYGLPRPND